MLAVSPISIDYQRVAERAASGKVDDIAAYLDAELGGRRMMLGVDRLDYCKGVPNKLAGFENALQRFPKLRAKLTFVQHVVPSREEIPEYHNLRLEIEQLVGEINGKFSKPGWVPIHYFYHDLDMDELLAYYRTANIALVTPLKDGMNLVAKEYCAAKINENGVLILSEFAGAAAELGLAALLVNPYDVEGVANCIYKAFTMNLQARQEKMHRLRHQIRANDVFHWVQSYLQADCLSPDISGDHLALADLVLTNFGGSNSPNGSRPERHHRLQIKVAEAKAYRP